jgi:hypothetical protein
MENQVIGSSPLGYANHIGYSDVNPFEVIARVGQYGFKVRSMNAEMLHNGVQDLGFEPGGFVGHCHDQHKQRWKISPNPDGEVKVIRLCRASKPGARRAGSYYAPCGRRFVLRDQPEKFYDYNF